MMCSLDGSESYIVLSPGVLRFSQAEYVYSEDSGVGFVTVEGTPGLRVRVIGGILYCTFIVLYAQITFCS